MKKEFGQPTLSLKSFITMNPKATIFIIILFSSYYLTAQKKNTINYLDQKQPGNIAQLFAPGILSTDAIEHSSPAFSPDGKTVLWAVMKMPSYQTCLLEMNFTNNKWSLAHVPSFGDTTANEVYPNFSSDGDTLYFCSDRNINTSSANNSTLWYVTKTTNGWSQAKALDTSSFKRDIYANSISKNGTRYFTIGPHGTSDWNIYKRNNQGRISSLPPSINSKGYEDGPFIAADESYLIFESDRPTRNEGNIDLYISFGTKDGTWTEPMNMGSKINSASAERFARVSPDGKYLFFGRNVGNGFDIYWVHAGIIDELKKQAAKVGIID
jgi:Tol biopolymer transport system component